MITSLYAGLLAILYILLSVYVISGRFRYRISIGDGGNADLSHRIRVHSNFAEYVPIALILLFLVDFSNEPAVMVHMLGVMLVAGRLLHAGGLREKALIPYGRQAGMLLTFLMILTAASMILWKYIAFRIVAF